jgi:hypothetical protein
MTADNRTSCPKIFQGETPCAHSGTRSAQDLQARSSGGLTCIDRSVCSCRTFFTTGLTTGITSDITRRYSALRCVCCRIHLYGIKAPPTAAHLRRCVGLPVVGRSTTLRAALTGRARSRPTDDRHHPDGHAAAGVSRGHTGWLGTRAARRRRSAAGSPSHQGGSADCPALPLLRHRVAWRRDGATVTLPIRRTGRPA